MSYEDYYAAEEMVRVTDEYLEEHYESPHLSAKAIKPYWLQDCDIGDWD